jgi:hypothetical protein
LTLGRYGVLTPDQARGRAKIELGNVAGGGDPAENKAADRAAITIEELCAEYLDKARRGLILTRSGQRKRHQPFTSIAAGSTAISCL